MKSIVRFVRIVRALFVLIALALGALGQSLPAHAAVTGEAASMSVVHAMSVPLHHSGMDGMSDTDKAICALQCLAVAAALPTSPAATLPVRRVRLARVSAVLVPLPHVSGPDGPPPKPLAL